MSGKAWTCDHRWRSPPPRAAAIICDKCNVRVTSTTIAKPQRTRILKHVREHQPDLYDSIRVVLLRRDN